MKITTEREKVGNYYKVDIFITRLKLVITIYKHGKFAILITRLKLTIYRTLIC